MGLVSSLGLQGKKRKKNTFTPHFCQVWGTPLQIQHIHIIRVANEYLILQSSRSSNKKKWKKNRSWFQFINKFGFETQFKFRLINRSYESLILQVVAQNHFFFFFLTILYMILEAVDLMHCYKLNDILILRKEKKKIRTDFRIRFQSSKHTSFEI